VKTGNEHAGKQAVSRSRGCASTDSNRKPPWTACTAVMKPCATIVTADSVRPIPPVVAGGIVITILLPRTTSPAAARTAGTGAPGPPTLASSAAGTARNIYARDRQQCGEGMCDDLHGSPATTVATVSAVAAVATITARLSVSPVLSMLPSAPLSISSIEARGSVPARSTIAAGSAASTASAGCVNEHRNS
jgi:hypothetical protein